METQETKNVDVNGEISLIDLLVVLLKFRKMIIGVTVAVFCLAVVGYFIYPAWQYNNQPVPEDPDPEFETVMAVSLLPKTDFFLPWSQVGSYFRKPEIIIDALKRSGVRPPQEKLADWLLPLNGAYKDGYREEKIYTSSNGKIQINENLALGMIEFTFKSDEPKGGALFLNRLVALGGEAVEARINAACRAHVEYFEESMRVPGFASVENTLFEKNREQYLFARSILTGSVKVFSIFFEPYTVKREPETEDTSRALADFQRAYWKRSPLFVVVAFLLSCFLAFTVNAIAYIKDDQGAMEKIQSALKKTGKDRS
jgi:hypothetical protein